MRQDELSGYDVLKAPPQWQSSLQDFHGRATNNFIGFKRAEIEQSIPNRFERQVDLYADQIAIASGSRAHSYDMLNRTVNRLARAILTRWGENEEPVALFLDQGIPLVIAILGSLKAGKCYVPLDPTSPLERNAYMLTDSGATLIVTNDQNLCLAKRLALDSDHLLNLDRIDSNVPDTNPGLSLSSSSLAYILYTSGSTGRPKGVIQNHRNVLHNVMRHTNTLRICPDDRQSLLYPSSVYGAMRDTFNALLNGAGLFHFPIKEGLVGLAEWLMEKHITIYCSVATYLPPVPRTLPGQKQFPKLRLIKLGGETVYRQDVELYKANFSPDCVLCCGLSSTETGLVREYLINQGTVIPGHTVPLGYPVEDMEVLLLDDNGEQVGMNCIGEIAIKSRYVAIGYWERSDLTQQVFFPASCDDEKRIYRTGDLGLMRPDGCLEHHGRRTFRSKSEAIELSSLRLKQRFLKLN